MELVGFYIISSVTIRNIHHEQFMPEKDLIKFLKKIEQLNKLSDLIKNNPVKKKELSDCKNHEEVITLTAKWGFEISKRWGEY